MRFESTADGAAGSQTIAPTTQAVAAVPHPAVIEVSHVGKTYHIWRSPGARLRALGLGALRQLVPDASAVGRRLLAAAAGERRDFAALHDISFSIRRGEAVGLIGRNGSGKSTLLQIIVGTLTPSCGDVAVSGRVAALLELGSAFHPEFTGRENVYLNGAVLGFSRQRMDELFDEIVDFADIGEFIDQPVKIYSSGMLVRLAFAVQVAVQPDILVVDEALAVGDAFFQAKCMRRIRAMLETGTTLLLVSHSMAAIREVCTRGIMLEAGRVVLDASAAEVAQRYLAHEIRRGLPGATAFDDVQTDVTSLGVVTATGDGLADAAPTTWQPELLLGAELFVRKARSERIQNGRACIVNVQMLDDAGQLSDSFRFGEQATCRLVFDVTEPVNNLWVGFQIRTMSGVSAIHLDTTLCGQLGYPYRAGMRYVSDWTLDLRLQHGNYHLMCVLARPDQPGVAQPVYEYIDVVNHAYDFAVGARGSGMIGGLFAPDVRCAIGAAGPVSIDPTMFPPMTMDSK